MSFVMKNKARKIFGERPDSYSGSFLVRATVGADGGIVRATREVIAARPRSRTARLPHDLCRTLSNLRKKKEKGYTVGRLKRQSPSDYRSVTYNQSGFDLDGKRGRDGDAYVRFSNVGWIKFDIPAR